FRVNYPATTAIYTLSLHDALPIWWITSALESNVGLNAISQYTFTKNSKLPQGLGTGSLYTNNVESPLEVSNGMLQYNPSAVWKLDRKSTRLNSSHVKISYAVFCLK